MRKLLSIVVPAYNVEKELEKCIDSCLNQNLSYIDYEIIIINDGSNDNTLKVANDIAKKNNNIIVINQENRGLSGARNTGLELANGKYIWFIDSDDYILPNVLLYLIQQSENENLDCLFFRLKRVFENEEFRNEVGEYECVQPNLIKDKVINGRDAIINGYNPSSACSIIMNIDFLRNHNLFFMLGIYHEDVEFTYRMISKAQRVKFIDFAPYLYFTHAGTMTRSKSLASIIKNRIDDIIVASSFLKLAEEYKNDVKLSKIITRRAKSILFSLILEIWIKRKEWSESGISKLIIEKMEEMNLYPLKRPYGSLKQAIMSKLILNHKSLLKL